VSAQRERERERERERGGGCRDGASRSEEAQWRGPRGGGAPLLGTVEDMLRKAPDMGISLHRGHCTAVGNQESGMGLIYWGLQKMNEGGL